MTALRWLEAASLLWSHGREMLSRVRLARAGGDDRPAREIAEDLLRADEHRRQRRLADARLRDRS